MKNGYNSRFLQTYLKQHIDIEDTIPELVEIAPMQESKQTLVFQQFNTKTWNQQSIDSEERSHRAYQNDIEFYRQQNRYINQIEELEIKLEQKVKKIKMLQQKQDQNETVIGRITTKNKQLNKKLNQLEESYSELETVKDKLQQQLKKIKQRGGVRSMSPLQMEERGKYSFDKFNRNQSKKEIYYKIEIYIKRIVQQFMASMKLQKLSTPVQSKIEEFLVELLAINSFSVDKMIKSNNGSRAPSASKPNLSVIATPQRMLSPKTTNRSFIGIGQNGQNYEQTERYSARKNSNFYIPLTDRKNQMTKSFIKDKSFEGSQTKRDLSQRRKRRIFD